MLGTQEKFVFHPEDSRYNSGRLIEVVQVDAAFLGNKLIEDKPQAEERLRLRTMQQRHWISSWVGEYVIGGLGEGSWELQQTYVEAMDAHRKTLVRDGQPLNAQVYAGYRGCNWIHNGLLFGALSDERALEVEASNQIKGVTAAKWRTLNGFGVTNPFVYMFSHQQQSPRAPMICSFDSTMLEPVTLHNPTQDPKYENTVWRPRDGLQIQDALQLVYFRE